MKYALLTPLKHGRDGKTRVFFSQMVHQNFVAFS